MPLKLLSFFVCVMKETIVSITFKFNKEDTRHNSFDIFGIKDNENIG